jgi:uncharacterized protein (TIGR00730 family)
VILSARAVINAVLMDLLNQGIAVFCGSSDGKGDRYLAAGHLLGRTLAERGAIVVYGGASVGTMGAVADAALAASGRVVGVIPNRLVQKEVGHAGLTELHVVETMHERKALMSERASGYVVLPGGYGTYEELFEVVTWKQLSIHAKPIVIVNIDGFYDPILLQITKAISEGFMRSELADYVLVAKDVMGAIELLEGYSAQATATGKWI